MDQKGLATAKRIGPWLAVLFLLLAGAAAQGIRASDSPPSEIETLVAPKLVPLPGVFDDLEERTFRFFWETADPTTGLVPDRYPTPSYASLDFHGEELT